MRFQGDDIPQEGQDLHLGVIADWLVLDFSKKIQIIQCKFFFIQFKKLLKNKLNKLNRNKLSNICNQFFNCCMSTLIS